MLYLSNIYIIMTITCYCNVSLIILSFRDICAGNFTPDKMKELREHEFSRLFMMLERCILLMLNLFYPKSLIGKAIHCT